MEKISVIIPTHNRKEKLKRAITSVLSQTHANLELCVIDDGSRDFELHTQYSDQRIFFIWTPQLGVSHARNLGASLCQGDWIAFLDSDDEWMPHKLERQLKEIQKTKLPFVHCNEVWMKNGEHLNQKKKHLKGGGRQFKRSVEICCISPSASFIKKELFQKLGGFNEDFSVCEDYDLWLRLTSQTSIAFVNEPLLIKHGGHDDQLSKKYTAMDHWRVKALSQHVDSPLLSSEEKNWVKKTLEIKKKILLQGFYKRNPTQKPSNGPLLDGIKNKMTIES